METLKKIWVYFRKHLPLLIISVISSIFVAASDGASAYIIKHVLDDIFINKNEEMLVIIPMAIGIIFLVRGVFRFLQLYLLRMISLKVVQEIRHELYVKMIKFPMSYFDSNSTGTMMARIINDVNQLKSSIPAFIKIIKESFSVVFLIAVVFYQDAELGMYGLIALPFMAIIISKTSKKTKKYSRKGHEKMGDLASVLQEAFSGVKVVKAFVMESFEIGKFRKENTKEIGFQIKRALVASLSSPIMDIIAGLALAAIIFYGGSKVIAGESTPGTFFSFIAAFALMFEPFKKINQENHTIQAAIAAAERVFETLDIHNEILDQDGDKDCDARGAEIRFDNVSFSYKGSDERVIDNLSLNVKPGTTVALVGSSGAGKSTLVSLIPRFYDVTDGSVTVGGTDVREFAVYNLRKNIGIVNQEPFLFNDTVSNNIAYGAGEVSEDDIRSAADSAYATDFIENLSEGFDTIIGERGDRLSGGQRQRITIARALLINPPILIMDEATSSLDTESERIVQKALTNLMKGRTSFVIAHRLSTVLNADMIVVMDGGKIESIGKHDDLLGKSEIYTRLYNMQFGAEES
ncbi:ABC transporter ATP-binding protein [Limisalsivibrio acetivorans]|uniref:ABC transporter ATP-binding protein n=1 Tax=Limisalsivibrio acetivorans TaxID=1304888 RepID=UPI0003B68845|nr:ABC transporter transmembrane domain-containing protein [Limisalsivibrio acetivorans]